ncbi:MAG: class II fructose-bisphosphate aldolase [Candidatus Caenarcaniphilales bacterium]|nr:class II fructose-bisphosphate aldolase [Candidatus Caenarcaniphilales bacterium]
MPIATPEIYRKMLSKAKAEKYAFPAINVTSMESARAAIAGFAKRNSDGIVQVSTGGAEYASGLQLKNMVIGAIALAEYIHQLAAHFEVHIALHTDHCQPGKLDKFLKPLIQETHRRRSEGKPNLFNSHMFDGSELPIAENMKIARELLTEMKGSELILEVEAGVVGGEEDGHDTSGHPADKLYTTPEDMVYVYEQLSPLADQFLFAATFGNVHGSYKPGIVQLKPTILRDGQAAIAHKYPGTSLNLVFHGGSGSSLAEIHETLEYGVVKMNVDTDAQYAYTRPIADHMYKNYDGVLKIDGEVGDKKKYDPRVYGKLAEKAMAERVSQSCDHLKSAGKSLKL